MIVYGGFYCAVTRKEEKGERLALLAGPYKTWAEANAMQETTRKHVVNLYPHFATERPVDWLITFMQSPKIIYGVCNDDMWVVPYTEAWNV